MREAPDKYREIHDRLNGKASEYPSAATMLGNAAGAAVGFAASGFKVADAEERGRRLEICGGCESYDEGRCRKCGCFMSLKARLASSRCPVGKW
jgi:hypothetical protein